VFCGRGVVQQAQFCVLSWGIERCRAVLTERFSVPAQVELTLRPLPGSFGEPHQPDNGATPFLLYLFTTLATTGEEALSLYGKRWSIETDLRTLKTTLRLEQLTCCTPDMVAKEIDMGIAAYSLVRALACLASEESGIPPRGYNFTAVRRIVEVFTPKLAAAPHAQAAKQIFDQMMHRVREAKLPHGSRKRPSYPRRVLKPQKTYPKMTPKKLCGIRHSCRHSRLQAGIDPGVLQV
jgi:hypothetical protein